MKIGLALSGGGFRATLYHLGVIRYLRDAGLLPNVTHITSVSGGSIFAAHLVLNWGRYNGSPSEFDAAAAELLDFVRLDLRNRIVRRYAFGLAVQWPRRLLGLSNRRLTRAGMLESFLEKYLYGDTSLFQLPEHPQLHILATNLSEGRICSFNREGLSMISRDAEHGFRINKFPIGLVTVPMAVAASSAFPGFFPPMGLTGADVGARSGEFGRQTYTDGGVFDNLGVRYFRFMSHSPKSDEAPWDCVLVSDVGKPFQIRTDMRPGGLVRTAMRASDILMDRVWQLETETFRDTPGFVFARITDMVDPEQDPTAMHPEIQKQIPRIRTDLDRFSELEISSLVRHGYAVTRKSCRAHPEYFGTDVPLNPPWDPIGESNAITSAASEVETLSKPGRKPIPITREARTLYSSADRRIWRSLLDYRDWVSYIYVPIIIPLLFILPYAIYSSYQTSHRVNQIIKSLAQGSRDLEQMSRLMEGPVTPWIGENPVAELSAEGTLDMKGLQILQDLRIIDLRQWKPMADRTSEDKTFVYGYRRLKILKEPENTTNNIFRTSVLAFSPETQVRFPTQVLKPELYSKHLEPSASGEKLVKWMVEADLSKLPPGDSVDITYEHISPGSFVHENSGSTTLAFDIDVDTVELSRWLLLPPGKEYQNFKLIRYETGKPNAPTNVKVVTEYLAEDNSILAFKLLSLPAGYTYQIIWSHD